LLSPVIISATGALLLMAHAVDAAIMSMLCPSLPLIQQRGRLSPRKEFAF